MKYQMVSGIAKVNICGVSLLVPDREAAEKSLNVIKLSLISSAAIEVIQKDEPIEKIYTIYRILSRKTEEESKQKIDRLLEDLWNKGYLKKVDE